MISSSTTGAERRLEPRMPLYEVVEVRRREASFPARAVAVNLSRGGIFVANCLLGDVGDSIDCRLLLSPREPIRFSCEVAWIRPLAKGEQLPMGMGLRFRELSASENHRLDRLVTRLEAQSEEMKVSSLPFDPLCESGSWEQREAQDVLDEPVGYDEDARTPSVPADATLLSSTRVGADDTIREPKPGWSPQDRSRLLLAAIVVAVAGVISFGIYSLL